MSTGLRLMPTQPRLRRPALLLCAALLLSGCERLTREHFEMIQVDVDRREDVRRLIGSPDNQFPDRWHYERPDRSLFVFIDFNREGIVSEKQWIDAKANVWDSSRDQADQPFREATTIRTPPE